MTMTKKTIKILAIDDNSDNLIVLKALINESFPEAIFISADSGKKGFELCQTARPDVILLDIVMPGMDGYEVCKKIKSDNRLRHIPVVMVTASRTGKASRVRAMESGAEAFIIKPIDESELKAQIRVMLRIKEAEDLKIAEKKQLEDLVLDRTEALETELADRRKAEDKLIQSLEKLKRNRHAILNLMEDLKAEISERRMAEERLMEERNLLRTLIDNIPFPIYVIDKECRKIIANRADVENICCSTEDEVIGKTDLELFPGEIGIRGHANNLSVIQTGRPNIDLEENFTDNKGEQRWLLSSHFPLFDTKGEINGLVGIGYDITDRKTAELEILKKQEFIETILENSPIGFAVNKIDDGSIIYVGSKFEEIYGVLRGSLRSVSEFFDIVYTDTVQRELIRERIINDILSNDPSRMRWDDIEITVRSGEKRFVTAINIPLYEQNIMISTVQDVTARNISEKALVESYEFNNTLLSTIPFGMDIVDEEGTVLFQSANFQQLFGDKAIGSKCWELYRDDKKQCLDCPLFNGIKIGMTENYESAGIMGDKVFDISHTGILFQGKKAMLEIFIDITERKQMEQKIIESEAYYRTLVDTSPDGIIIMNTEGKVSYGSFKAYEIFGVPQDFRIQGTSVLKWIAQVNKMEVMKRLAGILKGNIDPETHEYMLRKYDGTLFWGELSSSALFDPKGIPNAILIVCRDITDRKKAEAELLESKLKAEESDRLKTAFLHNISHEIRTPMNAIVGFSTLLNEPGLDKETQSSYTGIIMQSSNQLLNIVSDIIEISNIEAGLIKLNKRETNLNSVIKECYARFRREAEVKGIGFSYETVLSDSDSVIITDESKLVQVVSHLINNAVKFTSAGQIIFGYKHKNEQIEFFVSDTGIGIPQEHHSRIYDRFYKVENSAPRLYEGTGLGLPISKAFIELMGGTIRLTSRAGGGTTVYFTIPYDNIEHQAIQIPDDETKPNDKQKGRKTILIAEDEDNNYRLMQAVLERHDYNIVHAEHGQKAVEIFESGREVDLIIMDIKMPVMDGYEATRIIKKINPDIPIIAQTAFAFDSDREKALSAGCDDYLAKPVKSETLLAMIEKYI